MADQSARVRARKAIASVKAKRRKEQWEAEERIAKAVVELVLHLERRDAEQQRAGEALGDLLAEGLSTDEVVAWCDGSLNKAEVAKLRASSTVAGESVASSGTSQS
jgi:uncharacterized protein YoaH (UPF0181 family)